MGDKVVKYTLKGEITQFAASMKAAGASVGKLADDLTGLDAKGSKMRAGLTTMGDTAGKMGIVAAAGLGMVVKSAMDWESAWAGVQKTVNGSASEMAVLEGELRNLAKTLPASHQEIAAVAEAAGQLGVQRESVASFTRTMVDLGETTNLSADQAATSIARFSNIMGTSQADVSKIGSALVELGNNSATTEAEIMEFGQRLSAAGAIAGLTEGDVLGFAAAMSSVGVEAEAGGTALSKVFTSMRDAAIDGGEKLEVFAQTAGMTADEFTRAWSADPAAVINSFVQGLGSINAAGESTSAVFKSLGLTDQRLMKALLSAAEAGELLGESLDMGNSGFEENSALALEAAKRYETTASQVQVSWNNVRDAAIGFGEAALPVLASGAEKMAALAQAVGSLPAPVKSATTGLLGITAILGGGVWFASKAIGGVASMKTAMEQLGVSGDKASKSMKSLGIVAGSLGALAAIGGVIDGIRGSFEDALPGMEEFTKQLLALEATQALGSEFDGLAGALEGVDGATGRVTTSVGGMLSGLGSLGTGIAAVGDGLTGNFHTGLMSTMDTVEKFDAQIGLIDRTFANLAASGGADLAAETFRQFAASSNLSKEAQDALLARMPAYKDALAGIDNAASIAGGANEGFAGTLEDVEGAAKKAADALRDKIDAMRESRDAALSAFDADTRYAEALDDTRKALKENGKTVDESTAKGRANRDALSAQADAWNNLSDEAQNAPGAHRAAKESFVDMAVKMGMSKKAAQDLATEIMNLPSKKVKITADTAAATATLDAFIRDQSGRVINIGARVVAQNPGGAMVAKAEGGYISGPGTATSDSIPAYLSNGEYVVRAAAVNKYGTAMFDRLNAMHFADGGLVEPRHYAKGGDVEPLTARDFRQFNPVGSLGVDGIRREFEEFRRAVRDAGGEWTAQMARAARQALMTSRAYEKHANHLDKLTDRRASLMSDVRGNFDNDPFGNGLSGAFMQLEADRNDSRTQTREMKRLRRLGLNGAAFQALSASGDLNTMSQIDTRGEVRRLERLFAERARAQSTSAQFAGNSEFGKQIRVQNRLINRLENKLDRLEGAVERGARKGVGDRGQTTQQRRRAGR